MRDSLWPLKLLVVTALVVGVIALIGMAWLVAISPLPEWIKSFLFLLVGGSGVGGGTVVRRRIRAGKSPWSLDKPERG